MKVFRSSSKILIHFLTIECESHFTHGQIRAFLTSNCHTLRSFSFIKKDAEIPKDNDKIQKFIEKTV